jgi:hypothetical protein
MNWTLPAIGLVTTTDDIIAQNLSSVITAGGRSGAKAAPLVTLEDEPEPLTYAQSESRRHAQNSTVGEQSWSS